jgi:lipoprotein-releasing system permease protein
MPGSDFIFSKLGVLVLTVLVFLVLPVFWILLGVKLWGALFDRRSHKSSPFMSVSLASVGTWGIAISVFALILIQATMAGFSQDLRTKLLKFSPAIQLKPLSDEYLSGKKHPPIPVDPRITKVLPFLETEVIVHTSDENAQGAKIRGIDAQDKSFLDQLKPEYVENLGPSDLIPKDETLPGVLVGTELAKRLNVIPILTEEIELIYPFGEVDPTGEMRPKVRHFRVIGTFKTGYYDYDNKFIVADLSEARRLVPIEEVPTEWGLWVKNFFETNAVVQSLSQFLKGSFQVEGWGERNQKLFQALRFERLAMFLVLTIMIAIATFNVFSLTMMMVVSKTKEIAVFRALGMERKKVQRIFSGIGLTLGILGSLVGFLLGLGAVLYLRWKPLAVPSSYYLDNLPVKVEPLFILLVLIAAPFLAYLASWYPARRGGRFDIAESLRYE